MNTSQHVKVNALKERFKTLENLHSQITELKTENQKEFLKELNSLAVSEGWKEGPNKKSFLKASSDNKHFLFIALTRDSHFVCGITQPAQELLDNPHDYVRAYLMNENGEINTHPHSDFIGLENVQRESYSDPNDPFREHSVFYSFLETVEALDNATFV